MHLCRAVAVSVSRSAALAPALGALYLLPLLKMILGHATYAALPEIRIALLYALQAAQSLEPRFLPLGYQCGISPLLLEAVLV